MHQHTNCLHCFCVLLSNCAEITFQHDTFRYSFGHETNSWNYLLCYLTLVICLTNEFLLNLPSYFIFSHSVYTIPSILQISPKAYPPPPFPLSTSTPFIILSLIILYRIVGQRPERLLWLSGIKYILDRKIRIVCVPNLGINPGSLGWEGTKTSNRFTNGASNTSL